MLARACVPLWRRSWAASSAPPAAALRPRRLHGGPVGPHAWFVGGRDWFVGASFGEHRHPVLQQFLIAPVDFQPGQRFPENGAVRERALRADAGVQLAQTALKAKHLSQSLHVPACQQQIAKRWPDRRPLAPALAFGFLCGLLASRLR